MFGHWFMLWQKLTILFSNTYSQAFLWWFRDPIRVHRIENRFPRIREIYHRVPTGPYRLPNISLKIPWFHVVFTYIMLFTSQTITMLAKGKRLIESFWVKSSNWSKLTKHRTTVRSEAAVGKSVRSEKLCANVICPNVWRHKHKKVSASVRRLTELDSKKFLWTDNMHRVNRPFYLH